MYTPHNIIFELLCLGISCVVYNNIMLSNADSNFSSIINHYRAHSLHCILLTLSISQNSCLYLHGNILTLIMFKLKKSSCESMTEMFNYNFSSIIIGTTVDTERWKVKYQLHKDNIIIIFMVNSCILLIESLFNLVTLFYLVTSLWGRV